MTFTEEDIPLMKLIFNPSTHDMGMMIGGERAEEIFEYVLDIINRDNEDFIRSISDFYEAILRNEYICNFFWDNNILKTDLLEGASIYRVFLDSPIAEKIWDSNKLNTKYLE